MSDIDQLINSLQAGAHSVKVALSLAETAKLEEQDFQALKEIDLMLEKAIDGAYKTAFGNGLPEALQVCKPLSLRKPDSSSS